MSLRQNGSQEKIPVVINSGGFDSTHQELYFYVAAGARQRGYAVLTFDGPGQGIVLRQQDQKKGYPAKAPYDSYIRHDWLLYKYFSAMASFNCASVSNGPLITPGATSSAVQNIESSRARFPRLPKYPGQGILRR